MFEHLGRLRHGMIKLCGWNIANSFYYERIKLKKGISPSVLVFNDISIFDRE